MYDSHQVCIEGDLEALIRIIHMDIPVHLCPEMPRGVFSRPEVLMLIAAKLGQVKIIHYMVQLGANIHVHNNWVFRIAIAHGQLETVKYLIDEFANSDISDLLPMVDNYSYRTMIYVNLQNSEPLNIAVRQGHLPIVKYLIEHGSHGHLFNDYPLEIALERNHLQIVKYLLDHGAETYKLKTWFKVQMYYMKCAYNSCFHS